MTRLHLPLTLTGTAIATALRKAATVRREIFIFEYVIKLLVGYERAGRCVGGFRWIELMP